MIPDKHKGLKVLLAENFIVGLFTDTRTGWTMDGAYTYYHAGLLGSADRKKDHISRFKFNTAWRGLVRRGFLVPKNSMLHPRNMMVLATSRQLTHIVDDS